MQISGGENVIYSAPYLEELPMVMNFIQGKVRGKIGVAAFCGCVGLMMLASGCKQQTPADTRAADAQTIRDLDAQWSKSAGAHDLDGTVSYYSDDAFVLPPNAPIATTKEAIRAGWATSVGPGVDMSFQTNKVEVASSGDIAYDVGTYAVSMKDAQGNPVTDRGKYVAVWKKQADGKWKAVADTWNSDLPVAAAPAVAEKKRKK
jgi:ketosteroid isomerase-like protein